MNRSYKLLIVFVICMTMIGCYTMIKHPHLSDMLVEEEEYLDKDVNHLDDCMQCHTQDDRFLQSAPENYHSFIWDDDQFYEWNYYYARHWWYDDNYYATGTDGNEVLPPTLPRNTSSESHSYPTSTAPTPRAVAGSTSLEKQLADSTQNVVPAKQKSQHRVTVRRQESPQVEKKKVSTDKSEAQDKKKD